MYCRNIAPLYWLCLFAVVLLSGGCQKYETLSPVKPPAYLRVFNSITNYDKGDLQRINIRTGRVLTVLIDPVVSDARHIPQTAATIGDFIYSRAFYAAPYETRPNVQFANTEYPGSYPVRVAGNINNLDLSRWAQVTSGDHRVMILKRSVAGANNKRYFDNFPADQRDSAFVVALDTTLHFTEGEVYTLEVGNRSAYDATQLQGYLRQENFTREHFDTGKVYVNFYNMLTDPSAPSALDVYVHMQYIDNCVGPLKTLGSGGLSSRPWTYSQDLPTDPNGGFLPYNTPETLLTKISGKFAVSSPYVALPMPPLDSFYYHEGPAFGQFRLPFDRPKYVLSFYRPGQSAATGSAPYAELLADEFNAPVLNNTSEDLQWAYWSLTQPMDPDVPYISSLYQTVTYNNASRVFPLVSTIELLNTYSGLNAPTALVKAFQISLQRPYEASFIK